MLDYLVAHGIENERLIAVGKGKNSPIASNNNNIEGRFQNRCVELRTFGIAFIKQEKP